MNLFNRSIFAFLVVAIFLGVFLVGCFDVPDYPQEFQPIESINIKVKQKGNAYSSVLKVHPSDSATVIAEVIPEKFQNDLSYEWIQSSTGNDSLLGRGSSYSFYTGSTNKSIPNKLTIIDKEGNRQTQEFAIIINTPPVLADTTIPANGDTLYGSVESAFLFEWYSMDMDLYNGDTLFHTLEIDGKQYDVGTLLQVKQSGFKAGEHRFRIIVRDLYGDTDTLPQKHFYVVDTLEAK